MSPSHPCVQLACLNVSMGWAWLGVPDGDSTCDPGPEDGGPPFVSALPSFPQPPTSLLPRENGALLRAPNASFYVSHMNLQLFSLTEMKISLP